MRKRFRRRRPVWWFRALLPHSYLSEKERRFRQEAGFMPGVESLHHSNPIDLSYSTPCQGASCGPWSHGAWRLSPLESRRRAVTKRQFQALAPFFAPCYETKIRLGIQRCRSEVSWSDLLRAPRCWPTDGAGALGCPGLPLRSITFDAVDSGGLSKRAGQAGAVDAYCRLTVSMVTGGSRLIKKPET